MKKENSVKDDFLLEVRMGDVGEERKRKRRSIGGNEEKEESEEGKMKKKNEETGRMETILL